MRNLAHRHSELSAPYALAGTTRARLGACASLLAAVLACGSSAFAQNAASPARETPRPQDIDPAVDTSSPSQTPAKPNASSPAARETPRPDDINPGVDTSSASQAPSSAAGASTPGKPAGSAATQAPAAQTGQAAKPATGAKGKALDRLELDATQITGNRELPKVLYIVPWKRSDLGDLVGKPVNSLLDEVLTPVDRDVFQRENRYYRALSSAPDEGASTGPDPKPAPQRAKPTNPLPAAGSLGSAESAEAARSRSSSGSAAPAPGNEK